MVELVMYEAPSGLITTELRPATTLRRYLQSSAEAMRAAGIYCSQFFDVLDLYDDWSAVTHGGELGLGEREEVRQTWFISAWLLRPALRCSRSIPTLS